MDEHPASYYYDICEKRRDLDYGIYLCKECPFIAHFECALSLYSNAASNYSVKDSGSSRLDANEPFASYSIKGEKHDLSYEEGILPLSQTCNKCNQPVSRDYYRCTLSVECEYYLHKECTELEDLPMEYHPLHPQHPLIIHSNFPSDKSFVCGFCGETKQSRQVYQCSQKQCDFYLDTRCVRSFIKKPELLDKYQIQHVFHDHENHRLSPCIFDIHDQISIDCAGCQRSIYLGTWAYKCTGCRFYVHTQCSQVPKEVHHCSHPQHPLVLLPHQTSDDQQLGCLRCRASINDEFYLQCTQCSTIALDLKCYFNIRPTLKYEAHEHPLAYCFRTYDVELRCYVCHTPCDRDSFRCFACNFSIHSDCLALPYTVEHDDHVHPLTLTSSFKQDGNPTTYYCDICEKRRNLDQDIYLCKECSFIAHFECALSLEEKYAYEPWRQKLEDEEQEDMTLTNENLCLDILDELNEELQSVNDVVEQLIITKRRGEQLSKKLQEFDEKHANAEDLLRRLKQSVRGTNSI
ncbi:hypothetical protein FEM48_Zijuj10G0015400 [Ziziphus jujuba var. spinosa]|uniref:Phorbol-ester/DAG-type domain-containing protein n=1 Tax=Ziziphus jujuba var. spinosa TaxID=714518 RepID=A0A978UKI0_ZIZJJ|nr:hypothetical protein FEM48_Zijuj10G0015400 [Ziziphus jujuba var. spinosa]